MAEKSNSLASEHAALIERVSAMSAETFNATLAAYGDYQNDLNTWADYEEGREFDDDPSDPLPGAADAFNFPAPMLARICVLMTVELERLAKSGDDIADPETRRDAFTEAALAACIESLQDNGIPKHFFDDIAAMDSEVYEGRLDWSLVTGSGKDLEAAEAIARNG